MEMVARSSFKDLTNDEMNQIQGGLGPIFWTCVGIVAGMVVDGVIISTTGKSGGEWVSTGINAGVKWVTGR